jgi:hypothetical protein
MAAEIPEESETVWGWENYFVEVARFIQTSERQLESHANSSMPNMFLRG